jgi:peptidyl-prolyl cis-trans isomerase C
MLAFAVLSISVFLSAKALAADTSPAAGKAVASTAPVFAKVGDTVITHRDFDNEYANATRNRFYHGKPPDWQVASLQREIGDKLVNDALLLIEAKRRKLKPDAAKVKLQVERYEQNNAGNENWQKVRERLVPLLTKRYEEENLRGQLEEQVRKVPTPNEKQLRAYYNAHPEKFTEPENVRVSVILVSADPGAPSSWDVARKKAADLLKQIREGADFAEIAKLHSDDGETADQGGDMGYQHAGMMSEMSQQVVDKLKSGEMSEPVGLMEGIAIFKLVDRVQAKLNNFETVKERAGELYLTDEGDRAWKSLIAQLRKKTPVEVDESHFLPLDKPAKKATAKPAVAQPGSQSTGEAATGK